MFQTLQTFDTEFSADSVEWCPVENFEDIFVCGTYQLAPEDSENLTVSNKDEKTIRLGRIYLFQVIKDDQPKLKLIQQLDVAAVLDMKWAHIKCCNNKILLGVVNSKGFLQIYELIKDLEKLCLKLVSEFLVNDTDNSTLALSLDWSTGRKSESDNTEIKITVSDSQGSISLFKLSQNGCDIQKLNSWQAHEFEAWITAFDYWNTNIIYSGGDDCKFLRFDSRIDCSTPIGTNRCHNAGVTSLHSSWKNEFSLVSGSYDEILRTWDTRNFKRPLTELNLGGGIWRLKWDPYECKYLLAACMYNGFFIVNNEKEKSPKIFAEYKEHESIAYGCDWLNLNKQISVKEKLLIDENVTLVGTCSFYDHILKLSYVKIEDLKII